MKIACRWIVYAMCLFAAMSGLAQEPARKTSSAKPDAEPAQGAFYDTGSQLVPLSNYGVAEAAKGAIPKEQLDTGILVISEKTPSFLFRVNNFRPEHLRLLRLSRLQISFGIGPDGEARINLGGAPITPLVEPIEGKPGTYRVRIQQPLTPDVYFFHAQYNEGEKKILHLEAYGSFRIIDVEK